MVCKATEDRITQGLDKPRLKHPHHKSFHKSVVSDEDEAKGITRFYRWHIDAALYDLSPVSARASCTLNHADPRKAKSHHAICIVCPRWTYADRSIRRRNW